MHPHPVRRRTLAAAVPGLAVALVGATLTSSPASGTSTAASTAAFTPASTIGAAWVVPSGLDGVGATVPDLDATIDPARAVGVIVTYDTGPARQRAGASVRATVAAALDGAVTTAAVGPTTVAYDGDRIISSARAVRLARTVAARPGVASVEPNLLLTAAVDETPLRAPSPVKVDDPRFDEQYQVWDRRSLANPPAGWPRFPVGGWGVRAPYAWKTSKGSPGVAVAVLDTGSIRHPDLAFAPGYDMISSRAIAGDGNGRDGNAADVGDWVSEGQCGPGAPPRNSSWHGAHVAGTVAARTNNGVGIAGIAPRSTVFAVRVLGRCGGTLADIAAGITWASGGRVPGVPVRTKAADVINMSLGGGSSTCPGVYQQAIDGARRRGATIVIAAGNSAANTSGFTPANCKGVVVVSSTDEAGQVAAYTNAGPHVDLAAPGGALGYQGVFENMSGVLSTVDKGTKGPQGGAYAQYNGTSMATPAVAAGAALILARRPGLSPAQVESALVRTTRTPPRYPVQPGDYNCDRRSEGYPRAFFCGAGILDLGRL